MTDSRAARWRSRADGVLVAGAPDCAGFGHVRVSEGRGGCVCACAVRARVVGRHAVVRRAPTLRVGTRLPLGLRHAIRPPELACALVVRWVVECGTQSHRSTLCERPCASYMLHVVWDVLGCTVRGEVQCRRERTDHSRGSLTADLPGREEREGHTRPLTGKGHGRTTPGNAAHTGYTTATAGAHMHAAGIR